MARLKSLFLLALIGMIPLNGAALEFSKVKITPLNETLYKVEIQGSFTVNTILSAGPDGLLLVDTGFKKTVPDLKQALRESLSPKVPESPTFIISTHEHVDHVGGNGGFGQKPVIIGHRNLRARMLSSDYVFEEYPDYALPEITFTDSMSLYFNGEEIRIINIEGAHTNNDILVHFTKSGIAYMGDMAYGLHIPSIDISSGNAALYASCAQQALALLPDDTRFVSGHGRDLSMQEMREWQEMLQSTIAEVKKGLSSGKDIQKMQDEDLLASYKPFTVGGFVSTNAWIEHVVNGIQGVKPPKTPELEYYQAYHSGGIKAVKEVYRAVRQTPEGDSQWQPYVLYAFAYYLVERDAIQDAKDILEFSVAEYPGAAYLKSLLDKQMNKK